MERQQDVGVNKLASLVATWRSGHALPRGFYVDPSLFELDLDLLLDHWTFIAHESELAEPGAFVTTELGDESAIVVRGDDGRLRALANVCRHRGSRVCMEAKGSAAGFTCPYHAWTYRLDGSLRTAREMPAGFRVDRFRASNRCRSA